MNTSPQITTVDETIRIPIWRSDSAVKRSTRPLRVSRTISPLNLMISPASVIQPPPICPAGAGAGC